MACRYHGNLGAIVKFHRLIPGAIQQFLGFQNFPFSTGLETHESKQVKVLGKVKLIKSTGTSPEGYRSSKCLEGLVGDQDQWSCQEGVFPSVQQPAGLSWVGVSRWVCRVVLGSLLQYRVKGKLSLYVRLSMSSELRQSVGRSMYCHLCPLDSEFPRDRLK